MHGKRLESHRGLAEDVATSLLDGFFEERCKVVVLMTMVLAFTLDTNDAVAGAGDATNASTIVNGSPEGASKGSGGREDSELVCWYWRTSECRKMQKDHDI